MKSLTQAGYLRFLGLAAQRRGAFEDGEPAPLVRVRFMAWTEEPAAASRWSSTRSRPLPWSLPCTGTRARTSTASCSSLEFGHFAYVKAIRGWRWSPKLRARTMDPVGVTP
jgi:hypothetical protein